MEEIEFSQWLFEGRPRQGKNVLPDGLNWLCYFAGSSKSHRENSISAVNRYTLSSFLFSAIDGFNTVPLTRFLRNAVFFKMRVMWGLDVLLTYNQNF